MAGLSSQGLVSEALKSFECMRKRNVSPDATTFRCVLKACAKVGALEKGNEIYAELVRQGLLDEEGLDSALVDMYVKCGALTKARDVFENSSDRDVVSWTALINGYAQNGHNQDAVYCFEAMQAEGLSPDGISLLSLLNAFSALCFVKEGQALVDTLCKTCEFSPLQEHYACMVHLLSRSGHLDQAVHFIKKVSSDGEDLALWFTLLGACREWGSIEFGRLAFHHATKHLLSSGEPFCVP
jgi:pentatricopeptide repeat protein